MSILRREIFVERLDHHGTHTVDKYGQLQTFHVRDTGLVRGTFPDARLRTYRTDDVYLYGCTRDRLAGLFPLDPNGKIDIHPFLKDNIFGYYDLKRVFLCLGFEVFQDDFVQ